MWTWVSQMALEFTFVCVLLVSSGQVSLSSLTKSHQVWLSIMSTLYIHKNTLIMAIFNVYMVS